MHRGALTRKISVLVIVLVCLHIEDLHSFLAGRVAEMDDLVAFRPRLAFGVLDFQHAEVIVTAIVVIFIQEATAISAAASESQLISCESRPRAVEDRH